MFLLSAATLMCGQGAQYPDAPGKEVAQKVCNTCHGAEVTLAKGRTRQQWGEVITSMVTRGAKASDQEFATVLDYLAKNLPPDSRPTAAAGAPRRPGAGPADVQVVNAAGADRIWEITARQEAFIIERRQT